MKLSILAGATSQTVNIFIQDSTSTTGAGKTGLVWNTASLIAYYMLPRAASAQITLATQTVTGAWSSGGFVEIDATHCPGWYRFDIPDAVIASGRFTDIHFQGASGMAPVPIEIELTAWNNQDGVRGGMTALPNTSVTTNGSLLTFGTGTAQISATSGQVIIQSGTGAGQIDFTSGIVKSNTTQWLGTTVSTPTVAGIPNVNTKTWNDFATVALPLVPTTAGRTLDVSAGGEAGLDWANVGSPTTSLALTGTTIATTQKVDVDTIKTNPVVNAGTITFPTGATLASTTNITAGTIATVSGNVTGSVGSVVGAVGSVTGAVGSVTGNIGGNVGGNVTGSVGSVVAPVAITDNFKKNQALNGFEFVMTDSITHAAKTGLTVTAQRSLDGAALAGCANSVTELSNGIYVINLAATDTNANVVTYRFSAAGADDRDITVITQP